MRFKRVQLQVASLAVLLASGLAPTFAAEPAASETAIAVQDAGGHAHTLTAADIDQLPPVELSVSFGTGHGPRQARFEGPLLWTVLDHAGATGFGQAARTGPPGGDGQGPRWLLGHVGAGGGLPGVRGQAGDLGRQAGRPANGAGPLPAGGAR